MSPRVRAPAGGALFGRGGGLQGHSVRTLLFSLGVAGQSGSAKGSSAQTVVFCPEKVLAFSDVHFNEYLMLALQVGRVFCFVLFIFCF